MKGYNAPRNPWVLLMLLVIGGLVGSLLGAAFGGVLPVLNQSFQAVGLAPTTVDLLVIKVTFGLLLKLNVASIIGFLLALVVYFKL
ncbi:MAG: DUF4321 domain-containing protein [Peptococcaceae bacterium]|nr:DUF4321 domain-containing protein [Peptococcaceae bacterium]MDH7524237.1 DUF4321 domain-containing protein [Peptococcaceae bacterium]